MIGIVYDRGNVKNFLWCKFFAMSYDLDLKKYTIKVDLCPNDEYCNLVTIGLYTDKVYAEMIFEEIYHAVAEGKKVYCMPADK